MFSAAASSLLSKNIIHTAQLLGFQKTGCLIVYVCVCSLRSVVNAEAEEIRILAAAHLQRSC